MKATLNISCHFSNIAHKYRDLRTTDIEPVLFIKDKLKHLKKINAADIGCGAGRYDIKLIEHFGNRIYLNCIDTNKEMLKQLKDLFNEIRVRNFKTLKAFARQLPLTDNSMDCLFTFNAVHHFHLKRFLKDAARILKNKGYLFIYTRLKSQNKRNIWGQFFPMFNEKEKRLYELKELKSAVRDTENLHLESIVIFKYPRISSLEWLLTQVINRHYSTFFFYSKEEFEYSLRVFQKRLLKKFKNPEKIFWFDENIMLVVRKLLF